MGKRSSDVFSDIKRIFHEESTNGIEQNLSSLPLCWPRVKRASAEPSLRRRRPEIRVDYRPVPVMESFVCHGAIPSGPVVCEFLARTVKNWSWQSASKS
jgi:hypothetical protein